jgi:aldehyde dehydrogenase (NAD+)
MDFMKNIPLTWATKWLEKPKQQYINCEWVLGNSNDSWIVKNPANGQDLCHFIIADEQQVEQAAVAANQCHQNKSWSSVNRTQRANMLREIATLIRQHTEELSVLETLANGKLYSESMSDDIPTCADIFDYYAGWKDKFYGETSPVEDGFLNYTLKEPVGVCGLIAVGTSPYIRLV